MKLTNTEKGYFLRLLNRGGNIPGFNVDEFNAFTMSSIGIPLCEHYGVSKGKSLTRYVSEASDEDVTKLLLELLTNYEENYPHFHYDTGYGEEDEFAPIWDQISSEKEPEYRKLYEKCKAVANRLTSENQYTDDAAKSIKKAFSSEYIDNQLAIMLPMQKENPTEAIGKAKELIESCCKGILEENGQTYDSTWDAPRLVKETTNFLKVAPENIPSDIRGAESMKSILKSLRAIANGLNELRNVYGSGHGKSPNYQGLCERHARLAVGSALTLVNFLWDSHLHIKNNPPKTT